MSDWTAGYVADIGYTYGYYPELNPARIALPLFASGWAPPASMQTACELGFGQGLSINVHAAASDTQWYGTDFNPSQASFSQEMARATGGGNCHVFDQAFAEFCQRSDLHAGTADAGSGPENTAGKPSPACSFRAFVPGQASR